MRKTIGQILIYGVLCALMLGCSDDKEVKVSQGGNKADIQQAESLDKESYAGLEDTFLDTKTIRTQQDKIALLIFGKNNCVYCDKIKDDIKANSELKAFLQAHFLPYYINTSYTKIHALHFTDSTQELSTNALMDTYVKSAMRPTPTLVFLDTQGKSVFELPGYVNPKVLLHILEYIQSKQWQEKDKVQIANDINKIIQSL